MAVQFTNGAAKPVKDIDYSEFRAEVRRGNVSEVTIIDGRALEGKVKTPWRNPPARAGACPASAPGAR